MNHEEGAAVGWQGEGGRGGGGGISSATGRCVWCLVDEGGTPVGIEENFLPCSARKGGRNKGRTE